MFNAFSPTRPDESSPDSRKASWDILLPSADKVSWCAVCWTASLPTERYRISFSLYRSSPRAAALLQKDHAVESGAVGVKLRNEPR